MTGGGRDFVRVYADKFNGVPLETLSVRPSRFITVLLTFLLCAQAAQAHLQKGEDVSFLSGLGREENSKNCKCAQSICDSLGVHPKHLGPTYGTKPSCKKHAKPRKSNEIAYLVLTSKQRVGSSNLPWRATYSIIYLQTAFSSSFLASGWSFAFSRFCRTCSTIPCSFPQARSPRMDFSD